MADNDVCRISILRTSTDNDVCRNSILRTSAVDVRNRVANPPICVQAETSFHLSTLLHGGTSPMI